jgi:hypothetical protein
MIEYFVGIAIGWLIGWLVAHRCIARECERLGGFYVDNKTFKCIEITENKKTT